MKNGVSVFIVLAVTVSAYAQDKSAKGDIKVSNKRIQKLFETMRADKYAEVFFPELKWEDIPALLELSASKRALTTFPRNPFSSQPQKQCPEGMVALWLVEGIRKQAKGGFPSLNALCLPEVRTDKNWDEVSARNQEAAAKAYHEWWQRARSLPREKAAAIDPLQRAKLRWY